MSSEVEFEEDGSSYSRPTPTATQSTPGFSSQPQYSQPTQSSPYSNQGASGLTGLIMHIGLTKSPETAQKILIGIMIINFIITLLVIMYFI